MRSQVLNFVVYMLIGRYFRQNLIERLGLSNLLSGRLFHARSLSSARRQPQLLQPPLPNGVEEDALTPSPSPSNRISAPPIFRVGGAYELPGRAAVTFRGRAATATTNVAHEFHNARESALFARAMHRFC